MRTWERGGRALGPKVKFTLSLLTLRQGLTAQAGLHLLTEDAAQLGLQLVTNYSGNDPVLTDSKGSLRIMC